MHICSGEIYGKQTAMLPSKQRKRARKPTRCPHTLDFLAERADSQRPAPLVADLFN